MKRREFLSTTAMAVGGAAVLGDSWAQGKGKGKPIGLQLYTLRQVINKDVKGTIKQLTDWGYREFETYGYNNGKLFGMTSKEFNDYVKSLGARVVSGHYGIDVVRSGWDQAVADAKAAGQDYMCLPWIAEADRTMDGYKRIIDETNKAAEVAKKSGIRMGYHNHAFEFEKVGDKTGFEHLLAGLDPKLVGFELDIYWVVRAGQDPIQLMNKYPGRFEQWHVKDMDKNAPDNNADVGTGTIDWKAIFAQAKKSGMKHYYIEQESYPVDPMTSAKNSIDFLKTIV
jgi:sugar phosphate isomerase/epimerase